MRPTSLKTRTIELTFYDAREILPIDGGFVVVQGLWGMVATCIPANCDYWKQKTNWLWWNEETDSCSSVLDYPLWCYIPDLNDEKNDL